jgi:RHS repeat-associated protein
VRGCYAMRWLGLFAVWLVVLTVVPQSARAQGATFLNAPSPDKIAITPGGVDIRTGRFAYDKTDVSIGGDDDGGGIAVKRTMATAIQGHQSPFGNLSHNFDILLAIRGQPSGSANGYDYDAEVHFTGHSETFQQLAGLTGGLTQTSRNELSSLTSTGATGTPGLVYTYTTVNGTVVVFRPMSTTECSDTLQCAYASQIRQPDGTRLDFEYESTTTAVKNKVRLRSVTSTRGYAVLFEYGGNWNIVSKTCTLNLATTAKPSSNICPVSAPQAATYTFAPSPLDSKPVITGATNALSQTDSFVYASGATYTMGFKKAGQTNPWLTNTLFYTPTRNGTLDEGVGLQGFVDGSSFTYSYDLTPETADPSGLATSYVSIAGGAYTNALNQTAEVRYGFPATPSSFNPVRVVLVAGGYYNVNVNEIVYQLTPGPERIVDPLQRVTAMDYCDPNAAAGLLPGARNRCLVVRLQKMTDPEGNIIKLKYGPNLKPSEIRRIAKPGLTLPDIVETAAYTCPVPSVTCDKPTSMTDAKGITTDYTWDATHGGMLTETRPAPTVGAARPQKRFSYTQLYAWYMNSAGTLVQAATPVWKLSQISECRTGAAPACVGTADETRTTLVYGTSGVANNLLLTSKTIAAGDASLSATTSWTYDTNGNKLTEDGPLAGAADTMRWRYDALRRVIGVVEPDPDGTGPRLRKATRSSYSAAGDLTKVEIGTVSDDTDTAWSAFAPYQTVDTIYDALGRKTRKTLTAGGTLRTVTEYSYDLAGRPLCTAVRMNTTTWGTPTDACTLQTIGTNGPDRITKLFYNAAGEKITMQLAVGTADQADEERYTYTLNGKQTTITDAENNRTTYEYDGHDRLAKTRFPVPATGALASSTTDFEGLTYDPNGNVIQRRLRDGQLIASTYDALNRVTLKDLPAPEVDVTYTYDLADRVTSATQGMSMTRGYDALGRVTSESTNAQTKSMQYDLAGRMTRLAWPDGFFVNYDYFVTGEVSRIRENGVTSGIGVLGTYTYDDYGRMSTLVRGNGVATNYGWDAASRLVTLVQDLAGTAQDAVTSFAHNPAGQITSRTANNDAYAWGAHYNVNRLYNTNGLNQLTTAGATALGYDGRGNLTASGATTYGYTAENRLTTSQPPAAGGVTMIYDPTGRLFQLVQGLNVTRFGYRGEQIDTEMSDTNAILRRYVLGSGNDAPLVWYEGSGTTDRRFLSADERGSVIAVTNGSGAVVAINSYDEYGIPGTANMGRFQYTGQAWLPELGLYHYKARIYSPTIGRFLQTDPIGYGDGVNWYAYVDGDPVNRSDPSGLEGDTWQGIKNWAWRNIGEPLSHVPGDLATLPGHIANGTTGLPPTLSGGGTLVGNTIRTANAARLGIAAAAAARIEARAASLALRAGGNTVTVKTATGFSRVDLAGVPHFSKELGRYLSTPHVQAYRENIVDGVVRSITKLGDPVPATIKDLQAVEKFLQRLGR